MAEIKQYINLEPDSNDASLGRIKKVKLTMQNKVCSLVYVFLEGDGGNKDKSKLIADNRAGIGASGVEKTMTVTGVDGSIEFDLVLSNYGGDKFKVTASMDPAGKKDIVEVSDTYVVWKKLYYQLSSMKPSFVFALDKVIDEYKKHFIEIKPTSSITVPHKENLETNELATYRGHFAKKKSPFEAHIVLIDRQCDSDSKRFRQKITKLKDILPYAEDAWPFADFLVKAEAKVGSGVYTAGKIVVTRVATGIEVDIAGLAVDPTKVDVWVDIKIKVLAGEYTGDASFPPHVFIAVGKPRSVASKSKTVAHEIGHGIGMVPITGHDLHYENVNGGMGNHCRFGATPNQKSAGQGGTFTGTYMNGTCVMYAFSSEHYTYCATCKEFVREAKLYESSMKARKWG